MALILLRFQMAMKVSHESCATQTTIKSQKQTENVWILPIAVPACFWLFEHGFCMHPNPNCIWKEDRYKTHLLIIPGNRVIEITNILPLWLQDTLFPNNGFHFTLEESTQWLDKTILSGCCEFSFGLAKFLFGLSDFDQCTTIRTFLSEFTASLKYSPPHK